MVLVRSIIHLSHYSPLEIHWWAGTCSSPEVAIFNQNQNSIALIARRNWSIKLQLFT